MGFHFPARSAAVTPVQRRPQRAPERYTCYTPSSRETGDSRWRTQLNSRAKNPEDTTINTRAAPQTVSEDEALARGRGRLEEC
ncbi:hypothetical protein E2C01_017011 [Portunus trituberculatus]|uniref:Uncharacterized protein n=1 Tax=Portunus trituberculatus TaxID=210409 RepID=A0A5B7DSG7_PORTR|nr:hypothetical protein [Portunus trituberculatus]